MKKFEALLKGNIRQYVMVIALVVVIGFFEIATGGVLLMPLNISNIISQNAYILILATGMLLCILTGGNIDLSVGSVAGFVGAVSAVFMLKMNMPVLAAILISLLIGLAIGMWHGLWIAYLGVPAFIATLGGMLIFRGLTMVILQGTSLAPLPDSYTFLASGFIPDIVKNGSVNLLAVIVGVLASAVYLFIEINKRKNKIKCGFGVTQGKMFVLQLIVSLILINAFAFALASYKGIPMVLIVVVILVVIYTFLTTKTIPGRHIYAYGGNLKAAQLSGVNTKE